MRDKYCKQYIIFESITSTVKLFLIIGHLTSCFLWVGQSMHLRSHQKYIHFSYIAYNLKSTNSNVHVHAPCYPTLVPMKLNDLTVFESKTSILVKDTVPRLMCRYGIYCTTF